MAQRVWPTYTPERQVVDYTESLYGMLHNAGFVDMRIQPKDESKTFIRAWVPGTNIADYLISATIEAVKP
jgi:arsenite methyltransferase